MQTITEKLIQAGWVGRTVTQPQLARMFNGNLVNRALGSGELLQLRRGLYLLADIFCSMTCGECGSENSFFLTKSTCLARRACAALQSEQDAVKQMFGYVYC